MVAGRANRYAFERCLAASAHYEETLPTNTQYEKNGWTEDTQQRFAPKNPTARCHRSRSHYHQNREFDRLPDVAMILRRSWNRQMANIIPDLQMKIAPKYYNSDGVAVD